MFTVTNKVPSITQLLEMPTVEILKLPVNNCRSSELYKLTVHGISQHNNHAVTKQILALKYFVHTLNGSTDITELFDIVFPKLKESLSELLLSTELDELSSLIASVTSTLCDTVDSIIGDSSYVLQSLAIGFLDLLLQLYKLIHKIYGKQREDIVQLEDIVQSVHIMRSKIVGFLIKNEAICLPESLTNIDVTFTNRLTCILCGLAKFAYQAAEAKFLVEVWKCIATFCTGKLSKSIDQLASANSDESDCFDFLLSAVKTGCFCIRYGLQEICQSTLDSDQMNKFHGKSIALTISILQRLAATYSHTKFKGHDIVLTTLLTLMRTIRTQQNEFLNQKFAKDLQTVLLLICKSDDFLQSFYRTPCDEYSAELLEIGLEMCKKLQDDKEFLFIVLKNEDMNIVTKLLDCLSADASIAFTKNQMYEQAIVKLSSILIETTTSGNPSIVPRLLVKYQLQCNNIWMGYVFIDLWGSWMRCLSEEQCFNLISCWSKINENFSTVQSNHLPAVHVKILLQNLYDHLSDSCKQQFVSFNRPLTNLKLWTGLGLQRVNSSSIEPTDLNMKIDELLKAFVTQRTDTSFYKLIEHLRLIETMSQANTTVPDYLFELWNLNFNHQPNKFSPLIIPLIRISIAYQRQLNNSQHFQILQKLTSIAAAPNVSVLLKLEMLNYLRHIAVKYFTVEYQKDILKSIRLLFNKSFIDADLIVKKTAFNVYVRVKDDVQHEDILPDNITDDETVRMEILNFMNKRRTTANRRDEEVKFSQELSLHSIRHVCAGSKFHSTDADDDNNDDRLQEHEANESEMREIIARMQNDTKKLMECNQKHRLTEEFCKNIACIREELGSLK